jgi:redox-sensing transcriptional repressor
MKKTEIPLPSLRRLLIYYRRLLLVNGQEETYISSNELAWAAETTPEQVRKDLSFLPSQGRSRVGYPAHKLAENIENILHLATDKEAVLVGAGSLGRALALYPGFAQYGLRIVVLFDNDPARVGQPVGNLQVLPVEKLSNLVERMLIRIGIIATPAEAAQGVADAMVAGGIKAIWNFTNARLDVPEDVMVRNTDLVPELLVLSHYVHDLGKPGPQLKDSDKTHSRDRKGLKNDAG